MLTLNGVPTEIYQDLVVKGSAEFQGAFTKTRSHELTWENEVLCHEGEVLTYTDQE